MLVRLLLYLTDLGGFAGDVIRFLCVLLLLACVSLLATAIMAASTYLGGP